jgi:integrase
MVERLVPRDPQSPKSKIERRIPKADQPPKPEESKRKKSEANRVKLTKTIIDMLENGREIKIDDDETLTCPTEGQFAVWDTGKKGLSVLVSKSVKSFRATYRLRGRTITTVIGRVDEMELEEARETVGDYRKESRKGNDPKGPKKGEKTYEHVVDEYIEGYAKPNQRTWHQTQGVLKRTCAKLLKRPFDAIERSEVMSMLDGFAVKDKQPYKATVTLSHLKRLWRWAIQRGYVMTSIFDNVTPDYERHSRDRVYSDDEIKNIWKAADQMKSPVEGAYFKLLLLLAPRVSALAWMRRSHLDDANEPTLWVTPHELTKSKKRLRDPKKKRVYQTPLPRLAIRILKPMLKSAGVAPDALVFPGLPIKQNKGGGYEVWLAHAVQRLVKRGAPKDYFPHACRHTISTWLENEGCSEWERGLVLNHSGSSVTAGYSHGHATKLKLELLEKWAAHVESVITPAEGVAVLR